MNMGASIAAPRPGLLLGSYPQRSDDAAAWRDPLARWSGWWGWRGWRGSRIGRPVQPATPIGMIRERQRAWALCLQVENPNVAPELHDLRVRLGCDGYGRVHRADALGCAAAAMQHSLGRNPFDTQLHCAQVLLDGGLAEMATGEGKTLAVALAAAVAALSGVPVHVMTANDYLAQRDRDLLAPFFMSLGLSVGVVVGTSTSDTRRAAYACALTYCTAREVAFDHLRDRQSMGIDAAAGSSDVQQHAAALAGEAAPPRLLRGLCMALVDEADSLLIDEATMPLVLAEPVDDPGQRAACFQALALARRLLPGQDVQIDQHSHEVTWSAPGLALLEAQAAGLDAAWHNGRHRQDLVNTALVALHALRRDEHYIISEDRVVEQRITEQRVTKPGVEPPCRRQVQLLDPNTGRSAPGRVWARGLQTLVELKEGCTLTAPTRTVAQTSYQRFFSRYLHLAGTSGTLAECRAELAAVYGLAVVRLPLRRPCRRIVAPPQRFADDAERNQAVLHAVAEMQRAGRPVLVGCASVLASRALSAQLLAAGIAHRVLDARHDADEADEAAIVAQAGLAGALTVATTMAGRGTDIELGPAVAAAGGLHVIDCQDNLSARLDRQLIGRAARQGDPGSAVLWHALVGGVSQRTNDSSPTAGRRNKPYASKLSGGVWPGWAVHIWHRWRQRWAQAQGTRHRRRLLEQDLSWQNKLDFKRLRA